QDRLVKEKKPWAVAAVAALLVGCAVGFTGYWRAWSSAQVDKDDYNQAIAVIDSMATASQQGVDSFTNAKTDQENVANTGANLAGIADRRLLWAELMKALNDCLPRDPPDQGKEIAISKRNQLHITRLDCE